MPTRFDICRHGFSRPAARTFAADTVVGRFTTDVDCGALVGVGGCRLMSWVRPCIVRTVPEEKAPAGWRNAICVNSFVLADDGQYGWFMAKVLESDTKEARVYLTFCGWGESHNVWLSRSSPRLSWIDQEEANKLSNAGCKKIAVVNDTFRKRLYSDLEKRAANTNDEKIAALLDEHQKMQDGIRELEKLQLAQEREVRALMPHNRNAARPKWKEVVAREKRILMQRRQLKKNTVELLSLRCVAIAVRQREQQLQIPPPKST